MTAGDSHPGLWEPIALPSPKREQKSRAAPTWSCRPCVWGGGIACCFSPRESWGLRVRVLAKQSSRGTGLRLPQELASAAGRAHATSALTPRWGGGGGLFGLRAPNGKQRSGHVSPVPAARARPRPPCNPACSFPAWPQAPFWGAADPDCREGPPLKCPQVSTPFPPPTPPQGRPALPNSLPHRIRVHCDLSPCCPAAGDPGCPGLEGSPAPGLLVLGEWVGEGVYGRGGDDWQTSHIRFN